MASPIPCAKTGKTNEAVMLCHSFLLLREAEVLRERAAFPSRSGFAWCGHLQLMPLGQSCIADHHSGEGQRRELSSQEDTDERGNCLFQRLFKRSSPS